MHFIKIEQLIKRYQATDIVMFEILNAILDELKKEEDVDNTKWTKPKNIESHIASDFTINGGAAIAVIGVANPILRTYQMSLDERLMYFSWRIDNATITGSGAGVNEIGINIPASYKIRGGQKINDIFNGCGHHFNAGVLETTIILGDDTNNTKARIYRPALGVWANHTADFTTRGSILLPVEKIGEIAKGN